MIQGPPRALDVLFVGILPPHPGGGAISGGELVLGLVGRGHAVRALAPITEEAARAGDVFARRHPELALTRFSVSRFHCGPITPASEAYRRREEEEQVHRRVESLLEERRPDVIFVGRETYAASVAPIAARWRLPFVLRLPGSVSLGVLQGQCPPELASSILDGFRAASALVSPGRHLAELVRARGIDPVAVIPTAVDLDQFAPQPKDGRLLHALGIPPGAVVIAHVSNLKAVKRPLDLVRSAVEALRREERLIYLVVGDGSLRPRMERTCREAGIHDRFRFVGWVDYPEMPRYLNLADVLVMPSESEALARVYVETQACGRALLASDIPAAREVIVDGESGLLFRPGDIADLTAKALRLAAAPELRAEIGRTARARIGGHGLDRAVAAYERVLRGVVQRPPAA